MANTFSYSSAFAERETDKALLVRFSNNDTHWIPKSVIHDDSEVYSDGHNGRLVILGWFARKEGIDTYADEENDEDED